METLHRLRLIVTAGVLYLAASPSQTTASPSASLAEQPLIVQQNQGEVRTWRPLPTDAAIARKAAYFNLKVDQVNGGSTGLIFGSETLPAGAAIRYHRHLHVDEVLYIGSGAVHVHVGSLIGDARAGAIVFIPHNTWVSVKNAGTAPVSLLFAFNAPDFDRYLRCESVPQGQPAEPLSHQEDRRCERLGNVQYR